MKKVIAITLLVLALVISSFMLAVLAIEQTSQLKNSERIEGD